MITVYDPAAPRHPSPIMPRPNLSSRYAVPSPSLPRSRSSEFPSSPDPYYRHEAIANLCARFINNLFHCPELPPSSDPTQTPQSRALISTLAQIQLKVNAAATGIQLDSKVARLLRNARQTLRVFFQDDIENLKATADFSTSYLSFCEFLISHGDEIIWEDCVKLHDSLTKMARELSKRAAHSVHECEKLREELRECGDSLSDFLRSTGAANQDRHWLDYIKDFLGTASGRDCRNDLVDSFDCALKAMIAHQRSIAQFWEDQEASLIALGSSVYSKPPDPEKLRSEIAGWQLIEAAFLSTIPRFPTHVDIPADEHTTANDIIFTPVTPYLTGLVTNANFIRNALSTFRDTLVSKPVTKLNTIISKTCVTVSNRFIGIKSYLHACKRVANEYYTFYSSKPSTVEPPLDSTSELLGTIWRAQMDWTSFRLDFKKNSRRLSGFLSKNLTNKHQPQNARSSQDAEAQEQSPELDLEKIQAYNEGIAYNLHPDVVYYKIAIRSIHRHATALYRFWKKQADSLDELASALRSGRNVCAGEALKCEIDLWTMILASLESHDYTQALELHT